VGNYKYLSVVFVKVIKSRRMRWVWHIAHMGEMRNKHRILVRKQEKPLGRPRHKWKDNNVTKVDM
jgi:hypothetical protein